MSAPLVLPGFANVHSHAFQRRLRGRVQARDPARQDTFWTWREQMYGLAASLDLAEIEAISRLCYAECVEAGYTAVGEFHYLHHGPGGAAWPDPVASAKAVMRAARDVGIRINLLWTVYAAGGIGEPLRPEQARFGVASLDDVWRHVDRLGAGERRARVGLALHSVRAVPRAWMGPLAEGARARGMRVHAHVSEQRREVEVCRDKTGLSPVGLLASEGVLGPDFTAVHATWLSDQDVQLLAHSGAGVCLCPTTEGDLGDGVPRTAALHAAGVPLSIGSDSHAVIDPFSELRLAELQARAATETRCVLTDEAGEVAPVLQRIGHDNGYAALGLEGDDDRVTLRAARALEDVGDTRAAALTAGHPGLVERVEIAGEVIVRDGRHVAV